MSTAPILKFTPHGIYCPQGDFYIDPWKPVKRALITHAHADHARSGSKLYLAHPLTAAIMHHRLGAELSIETVDYGEKRIINGVQVSFHPAGHVPGSSQIRVEHKGQVWVAAGDYKVENDGLSTPFEAIRCDGFITESTFALPVFNWKPQPVILEDMRTWIESNLVRSQPSIFYAYSLGKAQRLLKMFQSFDIPVFCHAAVAGSNRVLETAGLEIGAWQPLTSDPKALRKASIVIAPPAVFGGKWSKALKEAGHAHVSGWMALRGTRRRAGVEKGFVMSDHADWKGLSQAIEQTGAERVVCTHGYSEILARWLKEKGLRATTEATEYESEGGEE